MNSVILSKRSEKFLERLALKDRIRIMQAVFKLPDGDVSFMKGRPGDFRLRIGDWRAIFEYRENGIFVKEIGNRGDVYK